MDLKYAYLKFPKIKTRINSRLEEIYGRDYARQYINYLLYIILCMYLSYF